MLHGNHASDPGHIDRRFELLAAGLFYQRQGRVDVRDRHRAQPTPRFGPVAIFARVEDPAEVMALVGDDAVSTVVPDVELPTEKLAVELACGFSVAGHEMVPDELSGNLRRALLLHERRNVDTAIAPSNRSRPEQGHGRQQACVSHGRA